MQGPQLSRYHDEVVGIDIIRPVVSWKVNDAIRQTAFELRYSINGGDGVFVNCQTDKMYYRIEEAKAYRRANGVTFIKASFSRHERMKFEKVLALSLKSPKTFT